MISGADKHKIETRFGIPDFVTTNDLACDHTKLASFQFADNKRKFPTHTKGTCYLSNALYFDSAVMDKSANASIGQNLLKSAKFWKIEDVVKDRILAKVAEAANHSSVDSLDASKFGFVGKDLNGHEIRLYPMIDADTVKLAADAFFMDRFALDLATKRKVANNILEKASEHKVSVAENIQEYLEKAAGRGLAPANVLAAVIEKRAALLRTKKGFNKEVSTLNELSKSVKSAKASNALSCKVASALDALDKSTSLYKHYTSGLALPEEACHPVLAKHAHEALADLVDVGGNLYSRQELAQVRSQLFVNELSLDKTAEFNSADIAKFLAVMDSASISPVKVSFSLSDFK